MELDLLGVLEYTNLTCQIRSSLDKDTPIHFYDEYLDPSRLDHCSASTIKLASPNGTDDVDDEVAASAFDYHDIFANP